MKRISTVCLLSAIFFLLAGCTTKPPSEKQLIEDIPEEFITLLVDGEEAELEITAFDLEKRQDEDQRSRMHGVVTMENDDFIITAKCSFKYIHYKNGWVLEDWELVNGHYEVALKNDVSQDRADELLAEYYEDYSFVESYVDHSGDAHTYSFIYTVSSGGKNCSFEGYVRVSYSMGTSRSVETIQENYANTISINWTKDISEIEDTEFDWKINGSWHCKMDHIDLYFDINSFDGEIMDLSVKDIVTYGEDTEELTFEGKPEISYDFDIPWEPDMVIEFEIGRFGGTQHHFRIHMYKDFAYVEVGGLSGDAERIG